MVTRRGREKKVCARGAWVALPGGPSTSPLDGMDSPPLEIKDHLGRSVRVGSRVKVLTVSEAVLRSLPDDERALVREMIGAVFDVEEIDSHGQAWVTKWWKHGPRHSTSHGIGLSSSEIEVV